MVDCLFPLHSGSIQDCQYIDFDWNTKENLIRSKLKGRLGSVGSLEMTTV